MATQVFLPRPVVPGHEQVAAPSCNLVEATLCQIWSRVLQVNRVGLDDDFFELGGDSLAAVEILAAIQREWGASLPLTALLEGRTVKALARGLDRNDETSPWSPLVELQPKGSRPPFFCVHGVGGHALAFADLARHM